MQKLISFDLQSDFAFFKKPDYNKGLLLSYNMLHKPALLGILGAIIGLPGYCKKGVLPQYYQYLKDLPVGIEPMKHEKGNFVKASVKYTNTVGYANKDGNLLVEESMLVRPAYRCYLLLSMDKELHHKLYEYLKENKAEFIPYLGKNEFQAWFNDSFIEYEYEPFDGKTEFTIASIVVKGGVLKNKRVAPKISYSFGEITGANNFCYLERLPIGFNENLPQYELADFVYTNWVLEKDAICDNLYALTVAGERKIIQLF